jgi:hypothetical protein
MSIYTPTEVCINFYNLLKYVNENHIHVEIVSDKASSNAIIGKYDWINFIFKLNWN